MDISNIKDEIDLEKTNELQQIEKEKTIEKIESIKNCYITYKLSDNHTKYYESTLLKEMNLEEKEYSQAEAKEYVYKIFD